MFRTVRHSADFGFRLPDGVTATTDWPAVNARKAGLVGQLHKGLSGLLRRRKVTVVEGRGRLTADGAVVAGGETLLAWAGLTEAEARAAGYDVEVHKHAFAGNGRAMIIGDTDGMVKVVAQKDGPILGFHIVGPWASELLAEGYLAVNCGVTDLDDIPAVCAAAGPEAFDS